MARDNGILFVVVVLGEVVIVEVAIGWYFRLPAAPMEKGLVAQFGETRFRSLSVSLVVTRSKCVCREMFCRICGE